MRSSKVRLPSSSRPSLALGLVALLHLAVACKDGGGAAPSASAEASPPPAASSATPAKPAGPRSMPVLTVDNLGPYLDGQRADLTTREGPDRLKKIVAGLPLDGKQVTLVTLKKAKTRDVLAVARELGAAGVPTILIKTDARNDMPAELTVVPSTKLTSAPAPCSIVATIGEDLQTRVWSIKGGTARLSKKGFAGPDYTLTAGGAKKDLATCSSDTVLFSGEPGVDWDLTFNLGGALVSMADTEKKIKTIVLLAEAPVAGRAVKVP